MQVKVYWIGEEVSEVFQVTSLYLKRGRILVSSLLKNQTLLFFLVCLFEASFRKLFLCLLWS